MSRARITDTDHIRTLLRKQNSLSRKLSDLTVERRVLIQRQAVLSCWCEALTLLQLNLAAHDPSRTVDDAEDSRFERLLKSEMELLGQLVNSAGSCPSTLSALYPNPTPDTIAPLSDPMQFLYGFLNIPPAAEAATVTAPELAQFLKQSMHSVSVLLHQVEGAPTEQRVEQLKQTWFRHGHMMVSLVVLGRPDVIKVAHCYNIDTMVAGEVEATAQLQATCVAQAVPALQLSEQQQELIAVCTHLHLDLLAAVHQERKGINEQMKSALAQCRISSSYDTTGSASSRADPNGAEQAQRIQHRGDLLDRQQQLTSRLTLLLHKEMKLKMIHQCWFIGFLTYEQLSRAAVLCYPHLLRPLLLAVEIMQQWDARMAASKIR